MGKTEKVILSFILLVGGVLRIYNYWDFSLSNDELSALARLNFDSFSDLIMNGVRIDGHPPAAQVILWYMTNWFGNSVGVVRFPFVLAGVASIYFMFRLGKEWISTSTGLLSAATFATLIFPILYSRIARPYALGMLFALMAATFWIRVVNNKYRTSDLIWLALSFALCAYAHYFAALVAAILAVIGLVLLRDKALRRYCLALVGAFILFLPYIPIFLHQLGLGGVGQWLGPPSNNWLLEHFNYVFNESWLVQIAILIVGISGYVLFKSVKTFNRTALPFTLFLLPFLIGFFYSRNVNPVLQNSTLLFSFPFLLIFLYSGWDDGKEKLTRATGAVLSGVILFSTSIEKQFYQTNHFGVFKELAGHVSSWKNEFGDNVMCVGDFNHPFYIDYYLRDSTILETYRTTDETGLIELKSMVDSSNTDFISYSWSTLNQVGEIEAMILEKYAVVVERWPYFNSEAVLFKKGVSESQKETFNFEKNETWNFNPEAILTDSSGNRRVLINAANPYGPTYSADISGLITSGVEDVYISIECADFPAGSELQMVYEQANENGGYSWESDSFIAQIKPEGPTWGAFHYKIKKENPEPGTLKVYAWLPNEDNVLIGRMEVRFR